MAEHARAGRRSLGITHWNRLRSEAEEQLRVLQQFLARPAARAILEKAEGKPELTQA